MTYEERLNLPWWWWVIGIVLIASIGIAVAAYVPWQVAAVIIGAFSVAVFAILLGYGNIRVLVEPENLTIGRYRIESEWIAGAEALLGTDAQHAVGPGANHRDLLITRPYLSGLVRITLADPADPHPHWLVSSRQPETFAVAVNAMAGVRS